MDRLKTSLLNLIKDDNYDMNDLKSLLSPIGEYTDNPTFTDQLGELGEILVTDRDNSKSFSIADLKLLGTDVVAVTSLVTGILLLVNTAGKTKLNFSSKATEELVFKTLFYLILVVVPKLTGNTLSLEEKDEALTIVMSTYNTFKGTGLIDDARDKIKDWFKTKGWCRCCCSDVTSQSAKDEILEKRLPNVCVQLQSTVMRNKELVALKQERNIITVSLEEIENDFSTVTSEPDIVELTGDALVPSV